MKTILFLGASPFQLAPIKAALAMGHRVITCDNNPLNPGHALGGTTWNISIRDRSAILARCKALGVPDGIVAFASDPAAPTCAWLCRELGLPGNPVDAVETMTYKDKWRDFQWKHGFNAPVRFRFTRGMLGEIEERLPFIVKPVDSSGSRGVTVVRHAEDFERAVERALAESQVKGYICEELIGCDGHQIAGDGFVVDGRLMGYWFANEHFGEGAVVPIGESFPWEGSGDGAVRIAAVVQKALDKLGFRDGVINFDIRIYRGRIYLMEIGARAGGNLISEAIDLGWGVDLGELAVRSALGEKVELGGDSGGRFIATYMIHSTREMIYKGLRICGAVGRVLKHEMFVKAGDKVMGFGGSDRTLGAMILEFGSAEEMISAMDNMEKTVEVI